jgi:hypothetical protein
MADRRHEELIKQVLQLKERLEQARARPGPAGSRQQELRQILLELRQLNEERRQDLVILLAAWLAGWLMAWASAASGWLADGLGFSWLPLRPD